MKQALITGITGQDGSYLAEFLLSKGYQVHGLMRRSSSVHTERIDHISQAPREEGNALTLHYGDLSDGGSLTQLINDIRPDEVYHLAAQSHVRVSFNMPEFTGDVTGLGTTRLLDAIRRSGAKTKFYQASSSEMFGAALPPQHERTQFHPRSPYAAAKVYAYWMTVNYREAYGLFGCNGILFNHESPRRGVNFVTRKITRAVAEILSGRQKTLHLGNLDAKRDWGYAPEYVICQWLMLQQDKPDDFVIGTGDSNAVRDFVKEAFLYAGIEIEWKGSGSDEKGVVLSVQAGLPLKPGDVVIEIDQQFYRPSEVDYLLADISKAKQSLKWKPRVSFRELVKIMVDADMGRAGLQAPGEGTAILKKKGLDWVAVP